MLLKRLLDSARVTNLQPIRNPYNLLTEAAIPSVRLCSTKFVRRWNSAPDHSQS